MATMSIYGKNYSNYFFSADLADILPEAYGVPLYIKWLKSFRSGPKKTFSGWGKFGKNDVKFQKHGL